LTAAAAELLLQLADPLPRYIQLEIQSPQMQATDGVTAAMRFQSVLSFENGVPKCQRLAHVLSKKQIKRIGS
jgi:hypothetical protein